MTHSLHLNPGKNINRHPEQLGWLFTGCKFLKITFQARSAVLFFNCPPLGGRAKQRGSLRTHETRHAPHCPFPASSMPVAKIILQIRNPGIGERKE